MHLYTFDENTNKNATLRVPNAKKSVYQADKYWDDFKSISGYSMIRGKNINYLNTSKYRAEVTYSKEAKSRCTGQVKIPAKVHNYIKVTAIGDFAFSDCAKITSVIIGPEVKTIGARAFENCSRLTTIKCTATTPPEITPDSFYGITKRVKFVVPKASLPAYKKAPYWKNFSFSTY